MYKYLVLLFNPMFYAYNQAAMDKVEIEIRPSELDAKGKAFGLLVRSIIAEDKRLRPDNPHDNRVSILFAGAFLLPPTLESEQWNAAMVAMLNVIKERKFLCADGSKIDFPEYDPEDTSNVDIQPILDVFLAWMALSYSFEHPEVQARDCLGPIFTFSAFGGDGVGAGYRLTDPDLKDLDSVYIQRVYSQFAHPENGPSLLMEQLDSLAPTVEQYLNLE
ncbi:MAG: hypothetical protein HUJ60_03215 [Bacilli bacterium]|nr:hypothetical protein [Bacilli bacterium]